MPGIDDPMVIIAIIAIISPVRHIEKIEDAVYERGYVYSFHYHLIWCTKYRRELFTDENLTNEDLIIYIASLDEISAEEMEVIPDHIHFLISFKPKLSCSNAVKALKGGTARLFLAAHPEIRKSAFRGNYI